MPERRCRTCGCTDRDCSGCLERTGEPCHWVEDDLCSACAPPEIDLGPCCMCETTEGVRNVLMLEEKCPTPGRGWGCVVCALPPDGAMAVLCDECLDRYQLGGQLVHACRGYPREDGRVPIEDLDGVHEHDRSKHELESCR